MDAGAHHAAALAYRLQRQRHEIADGRVDDRGIERLGRHLVGSAGPGRAQAPRERLSGDVSGPREREHRSALPVRHLRDDMGRGAEAVKTQLLAVAGDDERAPADQTGAQQRRQRDIVAGLTERKRKSRIGDRRRRKAAVARVAGEQRMIAQVFSIRPRSRGRRRRCDRAREYRLARRSPARRRPAPIASIRPTISWPGMIGDFGLGSSPSTTCRSVRHGSRYARHALIPSRRGAETLLAADPADPRP